MAGYRPAAMVRTPWGYADELRSRMLPPGPGTDPEEVARSQRERLFGATVASVAERGYEATSVGDLLKLSGVSRSAFYKHFANKEECFGAAVEAIVAAGIATVRRPLEGAGSWGTRMQTALQALLATIAEQPAAARMCLVEAYAAGETALAPVERALASFEALAREGLEGLNGGREMPAEMVRAMSGGMHRVIHSRLYRREEAELGALAEPLWEWVSAYRPPPMPLRSPRRRALAAPRSAEEAAYDQAQRIIRVLAEVVAEKGYPAMRVSEVAQRAAVSSRTFYSHFESKEAAMLATVDSAGSLMLAAALPAARRHGDWKARVRAALEAMLAFLAAEPHFAQLLAVEVYAAGPATLARRDEVFERIGTLLEAGYERSPAAPAIAVEAICGAVCGLLYDTVRDREAARLPEIGPLATYVALTPFVGPAEAVVVANGHG